MNNLKVVIVGQDPYPGHMIADGLAFSCSGLYVAENYLLKHMVHSSLTVGVDMVFFLTVPEPDLGDSSIYVYP